MNDNTNIITHIKTDPNAKWHLAIGFSVALMFAYFGWMISLGFAFLSGISIEANQRMHGGTNSNRESVMDIITTTIGSLPVVITLLML